MNRWLRSPLARLAWQLPVITLLILIAVLVPTYREAVNDIEGEVRNAINEEVIGLHQVYREQDIAGLSRAVETRTHAAIDRPAVYLLTDRAGQRLAGAQMTWPQVPLRNDSWFRIPEVRGGTLDGQVFILDGGHRLLVARRSPLKAFRTRLSGRLALATLLAFVGSLSIAGWTLGRYRKRMARIQHAAREILGGDLSQRLQSAGVGDELDQLALEFNQAFAEIEKLMEATRHVSSAIAHDMRRPIAAIRYRLEELPPPALPHLFERFYRADAARTGAGAGIGLALVRAIVEVHGGEVSARNAEPGLAMEIRLPLAG